MCYAQNYFGKSAKSKTCNVLLGFYEDEICEAKQFLFDFTDKLSDKLENSKQLIKRAQGVNKISNDFKDFLDLYLVLDAAKVCLPKFAAANLSCLTTVSTGEVNVYTLAQTVNMERKQLDGMCKRRAEMPGTQMLMEPSCSPTNTPLANVGVAVGGPNFHT